MKTTIQLEKNTVEQLKEFREYPKQAYNDVIQSLLRMKKEQIQSLGTYDSFLFEIQKKKMNELWNNQYDEFWDEI